MEDQRATILRAELEAARRERDRLDAAIAYLAQRVGEDPDAHAGGSASESPELSASLPATASPVVLVAEGEFWGLSIPKAYRAMLEKSGRSRPLKTRELLACLAKGGVRVNGKEPEMQLYRTLRQDSAVRNLGGGVWGLSVWYPAASARRASNGTGPSRPSAQPTEPDFEALEQGAAEGGES
jgi:hypothetical protein